MSRWLANGRFDRRDEYYTPPVLVDAILPFVNPAWRVWCPFDTAESEFVLRLSAHGCRVSHSHIWEGRDFFACEPPPGCDAIVSNPPYSRKLDVLRRLYDLGLPFAVVLGLPVLNYQEVGAFFADPRHPLQLLIVDKKVSFDGNTASFNNSYFCHRLLPRDLMFAHLPHNNTGRDFTPSRMTPTDAR